LNLLRQFRHLFLAQCLFLNHVLAIRCCGKLVADVAEEIFRGRGVDDISGRVGLSRETTGVTMVTILIGRKGWRWGVGDLVGVVDETLDKALGAQGVLEEVGYAVISCFLSLRWSGVELELDVVIDGGQDLFSDLCKGSVLSRPRK
jgi:hypothetical protein